VVILIESKKEENELNDLIGGSGYTLDFLERLPAFWHVPELLLRDLKRVGFKTEQGRLKFNR
jgi:hypothetical protein